MGTVEGEAELSSPEFCDADDSLALSVEDDADEFSVNDLMEEKGDHKGGGQPLPRAPPALDAGLAVEESSGVFDGLGESCHANGSPNSSNGDEASTSDPPEPAASDRFGFFLSSDRASAQQGTVMMAKDKEREEKWRKMKDHWEFTQSKRQSKLKRRVRKGLPNSMRSEMWPLLCGSKALMDENVGLYAKLLESDLPVDGPIEEDLPRTMYDHSSFCPRSPTRGKDILRRVLLAYGRYDRDVQYCQGINYIAALFLLYENEETSFWMLACVMQRPKSPLRELFLPGMAGAQELLFVLNGLLRKFVPKLARKIESFGLPPNMYAHPWFVTCFTQRFPYELVTRVWDIFLYEDYKIMYRVCIALFRQAEADGALSLDLEAMNLLMRNLPVSVDPHVIMDLAWKVPLKHSHINEQRSAFRSQPRSRSSVSSTAAPAARG